MNKTFNVGDRVVISDSSGYYKRNRDPANPKDTLGVICEDKGCEWVLPLRVMWDNGAVNSYSSQDLTLSDPLTEEKKIPKKPKQTPPAPKQRKLSIRYASGESYHLKNVTSVIVDPRISELQVSYNEDRNGIGFRINFTIPFTELTAIHFQDKVSQVSVGFFFEDGVLVHRVDHFPTRPGVFQC